MNILFSKYQGTGNDFVMIDNRLGHFPKDDQQRVAFLCDRKFGIGADGLILLENDDTSDFRMVYYNSDGKAGSMCGNGGRCAVAFAQSLGILTNTTTFIAVDGLHEASMDHDIVRLKMMDVSEIKTKPNAMFLDTGSPHHVQMVKGLANFNVAKEGAKLRYGLYGETGSNINFVEEKANGVFGVRTYERGVENETLSCGTGVTAVALALHKAGKVNSGPVQIDAMGGKLEVDFEMKGNTYGQVYLIGPATFVYKGEIVC